MQDTTWRQTASWLISLFVRSPRRVPKDVRAVWTLFWVLAAGLGAVAYILSKQEDTLLQVGIFSTALAAFIGFIQQVLTSYAGDVARYTQPKLQRAKDDNELFAPDKDEAPLHIYLAKKMLKAILAIIVLCALLPGALLLLGLLSWLHAFATALGFDRLGQRLSKAYGWLGDKIRFLPQPIDDEADLIGIKDMQVMPENEDGDEDARLSTQGGLFPHTRYWDHRTGKFRIEAPDKVPRKIEILRRALNLRFERDS